MRLTFYSDYSLRLLMYAALKPGQLITIQEVAEAYGISKNHLTKVAFDLGRAGFVETVRGRGGGLKLAKKASEIRLGDVLRVTEARSVLVECLNPMTNSCAISGPCRLKGMLAKAQKAWFAVLDECKLADLTDKNTGLSRILTPAA